MRHHKRAWLRLFVACALATTSLWSTAQIVSANPSGSCLDSTAVPNFSGQRNAEGTNAVWAAEASLGNNSSGYFALCVGSSDMFSSSSVWAAMEIPGTTDDIFQVGKVRCGHGFAPPLCDGTVHDFYAAGTRAGDGSCTITRAPTANDVGASPSAAAFYQVWRDASGFGNWKAGNGANGAVAPDFLCWWSTTAVNAAYFCETDDRGDECGGLSTAKERFNHIRYRRSATDTWQNAGGSQTNCDANTTYSAYHCGFVDSQTFDVWSDAR
jgi:hypothetical protein